MTQEQDTLVEAAYREYWGARESLVALRDSLAEIVETPSTTTEAGYLMYSRSGLHLHDDDYVVEQVARYRAAKQRRELARKRLIDLGEPDPE